ncbi:MAG: AAA family ATPase, partial [candidate division Zixibacteria bacterium]|nr:AAA family ATPase [candidate division Zixibacteria bacterium]
MNMAEHVKLTLVSAPAGYGKSTLAGEWVNQSGIPAAWLILDKNDNNLYRLITYIIAAIRTVFPDFGEMTLAALQVDQPLTPNTILTSLINELNRTSDQVMLVLDDYHNITDHQVHEAISYLLDFLSELVHLVILTRSDPPIPLGRLRAQGQLIEIRVNDLSFTSEETTAFLNETMGLGLSSELIRSLEERTEGWITGLQLAALSLKELDSQQMG